MKMMVQIGTRIHDFSDPTGLLSDCHRRIEMFLGSLQRIMQAIDSPLATDARRALETALRYFHEAAPKHTKDEEESLFPRLREIHTEVHRLGLRCLKTGHLPAREADRFRKAVSDLAFIYREHIRIEDDVVFPAAQRALSRSQKSAIANEMALRRELVS